MIDVENDAFEEYMSLTDLTYDDARTEADVEELSPLEAIVVEEREALRSDIADLSDMESWEEETLSAHTVDPEGKAVAQVNRQDVLQHDLRVLSEQGLSMLQERGEEKRVLMKGKAAMVEEAQVMSAAEKTLTSEKMEVERKQAKRSIEPHKAAITQEQQALSEGGTLSDMTSMSKVSEQQASQVMQEAL